MHRPIRIILLLAALAGCTAGQAATVEERYASACATCHASGMAGAPKRGDAAAWAPRLRQGQATLLLPVKNGLRSMPPKGLCNDCTDAEFKALIMYMSQ
jgi:cytochrome c5